MRSSALARWIAVGAVGLTLASCTSSRSTGSKGGSSSATQASAVSTAPARGVSADTIRIGFSYPDLAALAKTGLVKVDNGDYAKAMQVLVDDVNARGGIDGRKLELSTAKYSVLGDAEQLAACTKLTEDDQVFAVLGGMTSPTDNLCVVQQHATTLVSTYTGYSSVVFAKARAPWAIGGASDDRSVKALVKILDQQGRLDHATIGVYSFGAETQPLVDTTTKALKAAGHPAKETGVNDAPASDSQAANAQDAVIANRFKDAHIDTVIVLATVPPGTSFDNAGYHPTFYSPSTALVATGPYTNPYDKFPFIGGLAASADPDAGFDAPTMQHCREVWQQATGKAVSAPSVEQRTGKATGESALAAACGTLHIFVEAAQKAGRDLTPQSWQRGLSSIGAIDLPGETVASFAPGKNDAQDTFQLERFNPAWTPNASNVQEFFPVGTPITFK